MRRRRLPLSIKKGSLEGRILEELEKRGGVARQSDIIKALDAPRTTIWRKIRRLEKEGYVELERTEDATIVKLKKTAVGL
ncbi:MAG: winged helix-turn-helix transcriptional regulator, partial [Candidatus Korarchaeota archaeon]|nr:winged helix-turn-helix transcriptional regulator [Candidatus Korarchaeota archaeon]